MKYSTQMNDLDHVSSFFIIALHPKAFLEIFFLIVFPSIYIWAPWNFNTEE